MNQVEVKVSQLCPTLCDPMDCSLPSSSVHGILQARILEWVTIPFSRRPNPGLLCYRQILYHLGHQEDPHASSGILKHNHKNATWCSSEDETLSGHFFFLPCSLLYYLFFLYRVFT